MIYVQLDQYDYGIGISELSGKVENENLIIVESFDTSYIGRKYDRKNKIWTDEYLQNEGTPEEPDKVELLGQQISDIEIQELEYNSQATQEREFLGQQLSDLEISILERSQ